MIRETTVATVSSFVMAADEWRVSAAVVDGEVDGSKSACVRPSTWHDEYTMYPVVLCV